MLKILHFIFGRLYFQVKGYQTERFLNLCAKNHLVLWELKPVSDGYVFFIRRSSYQMLEALAEKANVDLALQGQKGLPPLRIEPIRIETVCCRDSVATTG